MNQRWYANTKFTAVALFSQCHRNGLATRLHFGHHISHNFLDAFERSLGRSLMATSNSPTYGHPNSPRGKP